jgi:hypothetical protein
VVLADGKHVKSELVRQFGFLNQVPHALLWRDAGAEIGKGGKA